MPSQNAWMGVDHYENFPVASVLCPPAIRPAVVAIYHFARTADDIADEGAQSPEQRLADLAAYRADLQATFEGRPSSQRWPQVFEALALRIRTHNLPAAPLHDLLDAFSQDAGNPPYTDRAALLDYCRRSANPIGRLLLHLYGLNEPSALQQSDAICTALQLINFWQDLSVDGPRRRIYVPESDQQHFGVTRTELLLCTDSPQARALVRALCEWASSLMHEGAPLALRLPGRAGWELRLVVQGGLRILEKIRQMEFATLTTRPKLQALDIPVLAWRALRMRQGPR